MWASNAMGFNLHCLISNSVLDLKCDSDVSRMFEIYVGKWVINVFLEHDLNSLPLVSITNPPHDFGVNLASTSRSGGGGK